MTSVSTDSLVSADEDLCWGSVGSDVVVFSPVDRRLHVLNSAAARVWTEIEGEVEVREVVSRVASQLAIVPDDLCHDVRSAIADLIDAGLCRHEGKETTAGLRPALVAVEAGNACVMSRTCEVVDEVRIRITALGVPIDVHIGDGRFVPDLQRILAPLTRGGETDQPAPQMVGGDVQDIGLDKVANGWSVTRNGAPVSLAATEDIALRSVLAECNAAPLAVIDDAIVFHAAGADLGNGVVMFPGVSNAGKSTLIAQLVERGHLYLTDEAVAVDVLTGVARPYRKSICVESGSQEVLGHLAPQPGLSTTWDVDPRLVGPGRTSKGGQVTAIVFPTFAPPNGATREPGLERLDPLIAMRTLLANAFDFGRVGQPAFAAIVQLATSVPAYLLEHSGGGGELDCLEAAFAEG